MQLLSVNVAAEQAIRIGPRDVKTGIYKTPTPSPMRIGEMGLEGDTISNTKDHGGPDQAVYVYGTADYAWWSTQLGQSLAPGTFGENLTVSNLSSAKFVIGDRLTIGEVVLEVTAPRIPCVTFAARMGDPP